MFVGDCCCQFLLIIFIYILLFCKNISNNGNFIFRSKWHILPIFMPTFLYFKNYIINIYWLFKLLKLSKRKYMWIWCCQLPKSTSQISSENVLLRQAVNESGTNMLWFNKIISVMTKKGISAAFLFYMSIGVYGDLSILFMVLWLLD